MGFSLQYVRDARRTICVLSNRGSHHSTSTNCPNKKSKIYAHTPFYSFFSLSPVPVPVPILPTLLFSPNLSTNSFQPLQKLSVPNVCTALPLARFLISPASSGERSKILLPACANEGVSSAWKPVGCPETGIAMSSRGPAEACERVIRPAACDFVRIPSSNREAVSRRQDVKNEKVFGFGCGRSKEENSDLP